MISDILGRRKMDAIRLRVDFGVWDEEEIQGGGRDEGWVVTFCVN